VVETQRVQQRRLFGKPKPKAQMFEEGSRWIRGKTAQQVNHYPSFMFPGFAPEEQNLSFQDIHGVHQPSSQERTLFNISDFYSCSLVHGANSQIGRWELCVRSKQAMGGWALPVLCGSWIYSPEDTAAYKGTVTWAGLEHQEQGCSLTGSWHLLYLQRHNTNSNLLSSWFKIMISSNPKVFWATSSPSCNQFTIIPVQDAQHMHFLSKEESLYQAHEKVRTLTEVSHPSADNCYHWDEHLSCNSGLEPAQRN
jgi:hypothetical protein